MIDFFLKDPRKIFLLDAIGALITSIMVGSVLVKFYQYFLVPVEILYVLAAIALMFSIYSFYCFWVFPKRWNRYLFFIAFANCAYCLVTIGMLLLYADTITHLTYFYFILEIIIVVMLVFLEWKIASAFNPASK